MQKVSFLMWSVILLAGSAAPLVDRPALAQEQTTAPSLCSGWNPETKSWGLIGIDYPEEHEEFCPKDYAFVNTQFRGGARRAGSKVPLIGTCCPLPAGALLDEHIFTEELCPDGYAVTGARQIVDKQALKETEGGWRGPHTWFNSNQQLMRCTKLDPQKYVLGPKTDGYAATWSIHFRKLFKPATSLARVPYGLRLGYGRHGKFGWDRVACLGMPWGSLVVSKTSKYCDGVGFRQLLRASDQAPVLDYGKCLAVDDPLAENPKCILERKS